MKVYSAPDGRLHKKQNPQNQPRGASRLGRELVGAGPGLRLRRSHGLGFLGSLGHCERQRDMTT